MAETGLDQPAGVTPFDAHASAARVAADMALVFRPWVDLERQPATLRPARRAARGRAVEAARAAPASRGAIAVAVTVGVLVGVAIGAVITHPRGAAPAHAPASPKAAAALAQVARKPAPPPAPPQLRVKAAPPAPAPATPVPTASAPAVGVAPPVPSHPDIERDQARRGARQARPATTRPADTARERPAARADRDAGEARIAVSRPICYGLGVRRRACLIEASNVANTNLRDAYERAARAGVPNFILDEYRGSWNSLRHYGSSDPERMIVGYRRLTGDLDAEMAKLHRARNEGGRGGPGPR